MIDGYLGALEQALAGSAAAAWDGELMALARERLLVRPHGDAPRWLAALAALPEHPAPVALDEDTVRVGDADALPVREREHLLAALRALMPWRKGPFDFFGIHIDTEWRSDWKWQRVAPHLSDLRGRAVLDVGCGSGYHCWRMAGAGARFVLGIDPTLLYFHQYLAVRRYAAEVNVWYAPVRLEEMTAAAMFDTVFSMGVLYHRRSPLDHLLELYRALRPGGELVLETLVVPGDVHTALMPEDRYARMRNVFFLPSTAMLERWLARCGFTAIRTVDVTVTTTDEQRTTEWMTFQSLGDFLMPGDPTLTREGYPAPCRATVVCRRPES